MSRPARFLFRRCVKFSILWRLLSLIFFVMPRHAGFDLFQVDVCSVQNDLANNSPVLIGLLIDDRHIFSKDHLRKTLFRLLAERLMRFRRIDAVKPDAILCV